MAVPCYQALVSLPANEWLTFAYDINDADQIVAETNLGRAFLLSPVPEPGAAMVTLVGLGVVLRLRRRQVTTPRPHP